MYIITENLVIREAASKDVIDKVEAANKELPSYIDSADAVKQIFGSNSETVRKGDLLEVGRIMLCFRDSFPDNYEIVRREDSKVVGYIQLRNMNRKTPSFGIQLYPNEQRKGYGSEALHAVIAELRKVPKYTSLLGLVLAYCTPFVDWMEKNGATELKQSNPNVRLFIRVYSFPLK